MKYYLFVFDDKIFVKIISHENVWLSRERHTKLHSNSQFQVNSNFVTFFFFFSNLSLVYLNELIKNYE